jgi:hypothetical protein
MEIAHLPKPGTMLGPCESDCDHINCRAAKERAKSRCHLCGEAIGYEVCFCTDPVDAKRLIHISCLGRVLWNLKGDSQTSRTQEDEGLPQNMASRNDGTGQ